MLSNSEEHREVFPEPPVTACRRCMDLKDLLVRARLATSNNCDGRGCTRCEKSRCKMCKSVSESDSFYSHATSKEYKSNFSFNCDSSGVVYLLDCVVCGVQYVGSTNTPFRLRFNNYKACYRRYRSGSSVPQMVFFRHFSEEGHHGFVEDIHVIAIDKLIGRGRMRESFWQHKLYTFTPRGLNLRK